MTVAPETPSELARVGARRLERNLTQLGLGQRSRVRCFAAGVWARNH